MQFLFPAFLLGALAIGIPIVLHFLRRDVAPEVPFTAVRLLQRSPIERSRRRRLRDLLLLAARVAALLLLAAAFARPYVTGAAATPAQVRIIAVDRSFSMGAPGRFARALDLARRAIDEAAASERIAVIAFDERADLVSAPGAAAEARAALATLQPGYGATAYGPMFAKSVEVADGAPGRLIVVGDLQRSGSEDETRPVLPASLQLEVRDAGPLPPNTAIAAVRVERERVVASVRHAAGEGRTGQVRVSVDGRQVSAAPFTVGADATVDVPIPFRSPASGAMAVSVDDPSGSVADNMRYVALGPAPRPAVLIVTTAGAAQAGFYLSRAFDAAAEDGESGAGGIEGRIVSGVAVSSMPAQEVERFAAIAILSTRGLDRRARDTVGGFVRRGGGVLIAAGPDVEPAVLSTVFDWKPALSGVDQPPRAVALSATDVRHPIFRPFGALVANLGQVRFDRAWRVRPDGWDVAARFTDGTPALLERAEGDGRVLLFASDVDRRWNDFPLHPAFVPFAVEAIRYASGSHDQARDYLVAHVPAGAQPVPGIYHARSDNRAVAVNVDPRESGSARLTAAELEGLVDRLAPAPSAHTALQAQQTEARQHYWQYGLLLMIAALVGESIVGRV